MHMLRAFSVTKSSKLKINRKALMDIPWHSLTIEKTFLIFKSCDVYLKT